jgi:L-threonylcarbamoyladenylate synthase
MARIVADDGAGRAEAIATLQRGGVVAIPTDTVYGLAVALATPGGIERLFHVKQRSPDKGIMLLLADAAQASELGILTPAATALADACWPGGLTLVVRQRPDVPLPEVLTASQPTIGLRVPDHAVPRALARSVGPLPVTSANVSGQPEAADALAIQALLGDAIDLIVDGGQAAGGPASTVVDCARDRPRILREGAIAADRLAAILDTAALPHDLRPAMTDRAR